MWRLLRALWSLAWLTVLLVGLPAALVYYLGWPLPDHWPAGQDWQRWVQQPLTRAAVVNTAAVIGWLLWAVLAYAVVVEILTRTRRAAGWLGRLRLPALPTPMQATASGMLGAAVFGIPTPTAQPPVHAVATQPTTTPVAPAADTALADAAELAAPTDGPIAGGYVPVGEPDKPAGRSGVTLPDGGWVTDETATAVASAAALVWLQRRRRYLPRLPAGAVRNDADLAPLPATVAAVQDGLRRRYAGGDPDIEDDGDATEGVAVGAATAAAVGRRAGEPLHPDDLPAGGVGLTGAGAVAAARGLLTAVLLSGRHRHHDARLITTATDMDALLGTSAGLHRDTPGLTVADSLDDAVTHLEQAVLERGRVSGTHQTQDPAGVPNRVRQPAGTPPLVLVTGCPTDPATARRLAVILTLAAPLRITGVLLGAWPHGTNWRVDPDGTTHPADTHSTEEGLRLSVLTATATTDLLGLLRETRPPRVHPAEAPAPLPPADHPGNRDAPAAAGQHQHDAQATTTGFVDIDPPAQPRLRLRVLGAPAIHHTGGNGTPLQIQRSAAVQILVFLAVHRDGATTGQLTAMLWPELRPQAAANRLYTPISSLRTTLHEAAGADVIMRDGERYRLDAQHLDVDLWRLHAAVNDATTALDPADQQRAMQAVTDTYTGELAAGQLWPWLAPHREATHRHVVDAYAALAAAQPDPRTALALLQDATRVDPCNEELHRRAMRGYAAAGDSAAARRLLASFTSRLADMGLETGDDIQRLTSRMEV